MMGKFSDGDWRPEIVEVFAETVLFWIARIGPLWHDTPEASSQTFFKGPPIRTSRREIN